MTREASRFHESAILRRLAHFGAKHGPRFWVRLAPGPIGMAFGLALPEVRRRVVENLAWAKGVAPGAITRGEVLETFAAYAACLAESLGGERPDADLARLTINGSEAFERTLARSGGIVLVTAHFGPWDVAAQLLAKRSAREVAVVMHDEPNRAARTLHEELRRQRGVRVFPAGAGPLDGLPILRHLRQGALAAFQIDRPAASGRNFELPFLGRSLKVPEGPFRIAAMAQVPVVPLFVHRRGYFDYGLDAGDAIELGERASPAELERAARQVLSGLEACVRARPTQWFHFADR